MPLTASVKAVCDHCGAQLESGTKLQEGTEDLGEVWSWAFPENWFERWEETMYGRQYRVWCSHGCVVAWLRERGRDREADEFESSLWMA
jgi:hypothetical protein